MSRFALLTLLVLVPVAASGQTREEHSAPTAFSYSVDVRGELPKSMVPLYVTSATLQGLDTLTTFRALNAGHREANPLLKSGNRPLMICAKIATASASIYLAEKLWKRDRKAAVLSMVITNVAMSMVIANNTHIGSRH
jgi:hypothetical protein